MSGRNESTGGYQEGSPAPANYGLDLDFSYLGRLRRSSAVSLAGTKPQEFTPPNPESVDQAAAAIVMEYGSDSQKYLIGIGRELTELIEQKRTAESKLSNSEILPGELREEFMHAIGLPDDPKAEPPHRRPKNVREAVAQLRVGAQPANSVEIRGEVPNW
jgi:hypothetical protein